MLIRPWDAVLDAADWQDWLAATDRFGILAVNNSDPAHAPVVVPTHFTLAGDELLVHLARANPAWPHLEQADEVRLAVVGDYAYIPTCWRAKAGGPDEDGVPTSYYSAVQFVCRPTLVDDAQGKVDYLNAAAAQLLGTALPQAEGLSLGEIIALGEEADRRLLADPVQQALNGAAAVNLGRRALVLPQTSGGDKLVEVSASPLRDDSESIVGAVVMLHDVTELRGLARQMSYQATHDALTGLVNRREFERRLQEGVEVAHRGDGAHVLCYLDLDRFKFINDTYGHLAGDELLAATASTLGQHVRDCDVLGRFGGEEFVAVLPGAGQQEACHIAERLRGRVGDIAVQARGTTVTVTVSIGVAALGLDGEDLFELLAAADVALYRAKKSGRDRVCTLPPEAGPSDPLR